eukprot:XP_001693963.1 hypothetical protein CHLREDRAFT_173276 [Chlamydomonas reinhardtii]
MAVSSDYTPATQALQERRGTHAAAGPRSSGGGSGPAVVGADDITAMTWLAFARPPGAWQEGRAACGCNLDLLRLFQKRGMSCQQAMVEDQAELEQQRRRQQLQQGGGGGSPPHPGYSCSVLLCGTRGGCLQLHDADSGAVLMRQQLHTGPVLSIAVRTWRMGLKPDDAVEDVTVAWADALVRLAAWELRTAAASCYAAAAARSASGAGSAGGGASSLSSRFGLWGSSAPAAPAGPEIKPLAGQKWELPAALRNRTCAVCVGQRPRDLYSLLQGIGTSNATATGKTIFLAGGDKPACLAALEVDEQGGGGGGGALSYISSVASGVLGLARTARSVAAAPLTIGSSIASFMLNPLQLGTHAHTNSTSSNSTALHHASSASSVLEPASSSLSSAAAAPADPSAIPLASFPDGTAGQRLPATGCWRQHRDDGRLVGCLAPAPHGSLVSAVDGLGRVTLVEAGGMLVSRMWKGYRDAQAEQQAEGQHDGGPGAEQDAVAGAARLTAGGRRQQSDGGAGGAGPQPAAALGGHSSSSVAGGGTGSSAGACGTGRGLEGQEDEQEQHVLLLAIYAPRRAAGPAAGRGGALGAGDEWAAGWGEGPGVAWPEAVGLELVDVASLFGLR